IARLRERGEWITVRRGAYMQRCVWDTLDDVGRHRARAHAVLRQLDEAAVASHVTAAVLSGLDVWDVDLTTVHVTRADLHAPRREAGVHHHVGPLPDSEVTEYAGGI